MSPGSVWGGDTRMWEKDREEKCQGSWRNGECHYSRAEKIGQSWEAASEKRPGQSSRGPDRLAEDWM